MSSLSRDYEHHTVTLTLDNILEWEFNEGWGSSSGSVTISAGDFDEDIRPAIIRLGLSRGAAPLNWSTRDGITPSGVRTALPASLFSKASVVAMLDAADEAHWVRLYEENAAGGKAREEAARLRQELAGLKEQHESLTSYAARMERERDEARDQRDAWKDAVETLDEKRVRPLAQELTELKEKHEECKARQRAARAAAPRVMWTSTAEEYTFSDEELQSLAESGALRAPLGSLVAELRAVIVSQAREIAKLKGESE